MKNIKSHFELNKENRKGILYLLVLLAAIQLFIIFYAPSIKQNRTTERQKEQIYLWQKSIDKEQDSKKNHLRNHFNPNDLEEEGWMKLGFSKKQAQIILKYKKSLGGFSTLAQIKKCFVISDEKFKLIQPYIVLNKPSTTAISKIIKSFNPNDLEEEGWMKLGFSKKQAQTILKYRKSLGGFSTLAQIKKCFVISDEKFKVLQPYIVLKNEKQRNITDNKEISNDLNYCSIDALVAIGIKRRDAQRIFNYRKALGGFYNFNQLKEIYLSTEKIALLRKKTELKTPINQLNINSTPLYVLKKHPYLSKNLADFLRRSREKKIKFLSIGALKKQYKGRISKKLIVYLSF